MDRGHGRARGERSSARFQSRAQLLDRYGDGKAAAYPQQLRRAGAVRRHPLDRDDLTYWSTLAGERDEPILTTDMHGRVASRTTRRVPVLAPAQMANLPAGKVVVFRRDMPPVIGRAELAYRRVDVKAHHLPHLWSVRGRAAAVAARAAVCAWAVRHAWPLAGVPFGVWGWTRWGAWFAAQADPSWALAGAWLGVLVGALHGWCAGAVVAAEWRPVCAWLVRRWRPLWEWAVGRWAALPARLRRRRVVHYLPYDGEPPTQPLSIVPAARPDRDES